MRTQLTVECPECGEEQSHGGPRSAELARENPDVALCDLCRVQSGVSYDPRKISHDGIDPEMVVASLDADGLAEFLDTGDL